MNEELNDREIAVQEIKDGKIYHMPDIERILGFERHTITKLVRVDKKLKSVGSVHIRITGYELKRFLGIGKKEWKD